MSNQQQAPVRFAYVGCGFLAQSVHIPNFKALPNCDFVALAEVRKDLGKQVAERYGIRKVYRSHEEIAADPEIEAVGVSGPFAIQGHIAEDLVRAGKIVFMEKPMAVSVARARSIVGAIKESNGKGRLMVAYMKRYDPGNLLFKKHFDAWRGDPEIGRLVLVRNHGFGGDWIYARDANIPMFSSPEATPPSPEESPAWIPEKWRNAYQGYLQQWTHNMNWLRFLLADKQGNTRTVLKSVQLDQADGMTGIVIFEMNGVRTTIESGYTRFNGFEDHTQAYFDGGWLRTESPPLLKKETPAGVELYHFGSGEQPPRHIREFPTPGWSYREEAKHFLHCARTGEPFRSSAEDTANDVELYEEIYSQFLGIKRT